MTSTTEPRGRMIGRVAFITGAARGQGRSHAVHVAREGGNVVAVDILRDLDVTNYGLGTVDEMAETVRLVEDAGGKIITRAADVRDAAALQVAARDGYEQFGRLDLVVANAAIAGNGLVADLTDDEWHNMIDINLTGAWNTVRATMRYLKAPTGSIVLINSIAGVKGLPGNSHYTAAKHGALGLMKSLAAELGPSGIRVNAVLPTMVATPMLHNTATYKLFVPTADAPTREQAVEVMRQMHSLPIPEVEPSDISNAVLFLASDEGRYITGVALPVDAGLLIK